MKKIMAKSFFGTLIAFTVYKLADVTFLDFGISMSQLWRDALFSFIFILICELIRDWLKTNRDRQRHNGP